MISSRFKKVILLIGDVLCLALSAFAIVLLDKGSSLFFDYLRLHLIVVSFLTPIWIIAYFVEGLYSLRTFNRNGLLISLFRGSLFSSIASVIFLYLFGDSIGITPKTNLIIFSVSMVMLAFLWRRVFFSFFSYKVFTRRLSFIGTSDEFHELEELFRKKQYIGFEVVSRYADIVDYKECSNPSILVVEDRLLAGDDINHRLFNIFNSGINIISLSELSEIVSGKIPLSSIDHTWFINPKINFHQGPYLYLKSIFDKLMAVMFLLLFLPILIVLVPVLLIFSGRPLIYSQIRVGANNKPYTIYKFRTMNLDAEKNGAVWAEKNDNRVTKVGAFLRTTRLDEIPQLWNVLNGTMSMVGPRPERPEIIKDKLENVIRFYNFRHLVKPGLTGWAQVNYGYGANEHDAIVKLQYDLYYIKHRSIWLDLRIVLKTIKTVLGRVGR